MKLSAHRFGSAQQRQERWKRERAAAKTLRDGFPKAERVSIELSFASREPYPLAEQSHVLHAGAQAFFLFPCPHANCDGRFDLTSVVTSTLQESVRRVAGGIECSGMRFNDSAARRPCQLHMDYVVSARYQSARAK